MPNQSKTKEEQEKLRPAQTQDRRPGHQGPMQPEPVSENLQLQGSGLLEGRVALITGADSGIGRAVAAAFAREGADVAVVYLEEDEDAAETQRLVEARGRECLLIRADIGHKVEAVRAVEETVKKFGRLDVLVNNAGEQHPQKTIEDISEEQLERTFRTNIFAMFFLTAAALPHVKEHKGTIINTTSVTAYRGSPKLLDYSATKGAIVSFTRSLSGQLAKDGVRVNSVAPGPIWTPLIPSTFPADEVETFGSDSPLGRAGQPWECAECYVFLAGGGSSYLTGQVLHPNGGEIING